MNENIDLTKILDGCPVGKEFYSPLFGKVAFNHITYNRLIAVDCAILYKYAKFNTAGKYVIRHDDYNIYYLSSECLLFPSEDQRDWSKFERFWDKPKVEKFDPKTLQPFDKVLVRDQRGQDWRTEFFSHIDDTVNRVVCCCFWKQCIPYNENTKHLVGTNNDCPEYYKWWEE